MLWALAQCLEVEVAYFFDGLVVERRPDAAAAADGS
jgi:hypothetical protein